MQLNALLAVARGDEPADLVLRNARLVNVFSGAIEETDIAVFAGRVAGIGAGYQAAHAVDLRGAYRRPRL
jgi:adenine deaminase